jgi:hypothetical protein
MKSLKDFREFLEEDLNEANDLLNDRNYDLTEKQIMSKLFCEMIEIPDRDFEAKEDSCQVSYWVVGENVYPNRKIAEEKSRQIIDAIEKLANNELKGILRVNTSLNLNSAIGYLDPRFVTTGIVKYRTMLRYFQNHDIDIEKELEKHRGKITSKRTGIA